MLENYNYIASNLIIQFEEIYQNRCQETSVDYLPLRILLRRCQINNQPIFQWLIQLLIIENLVFHMRFRNCNDMCRECWSLILTSQPAFYMIIYEIEMSVFLIIQHMTLGFILKIIYLQMKNCPIYTICFESYILDIYNLSRFFL